jgi:hypothetical protein
VRLVIENGPAPLIIEGPFNIVCTPAMREHLLHELARQKDATGGECYIRVPQYQPSLAGVQPRKWGQG